MANTTTIEFSPLGRSLKLQFVIGDSLEQDSLNLVADVKIEHGDFNTNVTSSVFSRTDVAKFADSISRLAEGSEWKSTVLTSEQQDFRIGLANYNDLATISVGIRTNRIDDRQGPRRSITVQLENGALELIPASILQLL